MKRRGFAITSCLGCFGLLVLGTFLLLRGCTREVRDVEPGRSAHAGYPEAPVPAQAVRPFRKTEFVAGVNTMHPAEQIFVSTKKDLICLHGSSCYQFGSFSHPESGFTVVIPNERAFIRVKKGLQEQLRSAGQTRKAEMLATKLSNYGVSEDGFGSHVSYLRAEQSPKGAKVSLEMRGPHVVRISKTEFNGIGSMQQGFKRYHGGHISEFCPELGILLSSHPLDKDGFALYNVSEEPVKAEHFRVPGGFTELFAANEPELPALLEGLMPAPYRLASVKKVGNQVEEQWSGRDGALILVEHCTFASSAQAEKFARTKWEITSWNGGRKFWQEPRFAAFVEGKHLVRVSLFGHDDPEWPWKLAHQLQRRVK